MSNINHLLERYRDFARIRDLAQILTKDSETPPRVQLSGLSGAQRAFVIAATAQKSPNTTI